MEDLLRSIQRATSGQFPEDYTAADRAGEVQADMNTLREYSKTQEFECLGEPSLCMNPRGCACVPGCKTPAGCAENGCLGWCDEHEPPTRSQKMRVAGYTRRPSAKSLPSDE